MIWQDADGRAWEIIDYRFVDGKRKRLDLGIWNADGRAFRPEDGGTILLYEFGRVAYRDTADRTLREQLRHAKPVGSTAAERMQRGG